MSWRFVVVATALVMVYPIAMIWRLKRKRQYAGERSSHHELRQDVDALSISLGAVQLWILVVAPRFEWQAGGGIFTGAYVMISIIGLRFLIRMAIRKFDRFE